MSTLGGDTNIVDDEEMSSQGSVQSPSVLTGEGTQVPSLVTQQTLSSPGSPLRPQSPVPRAAPTMQSSIVGMPSAFATTVPIGIDSEPSGSIAPTVPIGVPTLEQTKVAFGEVPSASQDMSTKHGQI